MTPNRRYCDALGSHLEHYLFPALCGVAGLNQTKNAICVASKRRESMGDC